MMSVYVHDITLFILFFLFLTKTHFETILVENNVM